MNKDKAYLIDIADSMRLAVRYMGDATLEAVCRRRSDREAA